MLRIVLALTLILFCILEFYMALKHDSKVQRQKEKQKLMESCPSFKDYVRNSINLLIFKWSEYYARHYEISKRHDGWRL